MAAPTTQSPVEREVSLPTLGRIWSAGLIALIAGVIINLLIRTFAINALGVSANFPPLSPVAVLFWTALLTVAATAVRAGFRTAHDGARIFLWLAAGVLVFSFTPDIALLIVQLYPDTSLRAVLTLMCMHVVSAGLCMALLALPPKAKT